MTTNSEHLSRSGKILALVTAVIGLVGAMFTAGLFSQPKPESAGSQPSAGFSVNTPMATAVATGVNASWKSDAAAICHTTDEWLRNQSAQHASATWEAVAVEGAEAVRVMDQHLRRINAPQDVHQRLQLMTLNWDQSSEALKQAAQAGRAGDAAEHQQALSRFNDLNARGNQIAEDLGLDACASVDLRL